VACMTAATTRSCRRGGGSECRVQSTPPGRAAPTALGFVGIDIPALPGWADVWRPALRALTSILSQIRRSVLDNVVRSEWLKGNFPHLPMKRRGEMRGSAGSPAGCIWPGAPASLLTLVRLEKHHRFSAICLTAGTPLLNRASRVFTSFAAFSM
jgi:hypothetical protein